MFLKRIEVACLVYVQTGDLQVDYAGLHPFQHVFRLIMFYQILHHTRGNGAKLV
jgi:hypothetical protein